MLQRSASAKYASSVFFHRFNDFDIFVEDTAAGYTKIYANLLSNAMSHNVSIDRVFPLGGRPQVITAARKKLESAKQDQRKCVYIVDGDLYLLCGEDEDIPSNVIRLPKYCIENFLLDENALISFMDDESPSKSIETLQSELDFSGWIENHKEDLIKLFVIFSLAQKLKLGVQTVKMGHQSICANGNGDIDKAKIDFISEEIKTKLTNAHGAEYINKELAKITEQINWNECVIRKYISAKDFSLPLILVRIKKITGSRSPNLNIKLRISKSCSPEPLFNVVAQMSKIIGRPDIVRQPSEVV